MFDVVENTMFEAIQFAINISSLNYKCCNVGWNYYTRLEDVVVPWSVIRLCTQPAQVRVREGSKTKSVCY